MTNRFQVIRTHTSPYQAPNFREFEQRTLEKLPGIVYRDLKDLQTDLPVILLTNTHTQLSQLPGELLKQTKIILHPNSGYDHFRQDFALVEKIPVIIGHEIRAQAVAEYSLACVFEALTQLPQHLAWDAGRSWDRKLIKNQECWIFGHGHIGRIIAKTLDALGATVKIVDPFLEAITSFKNYQGWKDGDLSKANIVIAACGLNDTSKNIFNREFFAAANPELVFINGARGGLVDEDALREFLLARPRAFAFLDVFGEEPFTERWHHFPQVWKTSHIAGVHQDLDRGIIQFEQKVLTDFLGLSDNDFKQKYVSELLQNKRRQGVII